MKAKEGKTPKDTEHSKVPMFQAIHKNDPEKTLCYGYNEEKSQFFYKEKNQQASEQKSYCNATELLTIGEQYLLPEEHRGYLLLEIPLPKTT